MAAPVTQKYHELVVEFSTDGGTTWSGRNCCIRGFTVNRTPQVQEAALTADCDDESLPDDIVREVTSRDLSVSGTGHWTRGGYNAFLTQFYGTGKIYTRIGNLAAASGEIEYEECEMIITLGEARETKGQPVTASIELQSAGKITTSLKA